MYKIVFIILLVFTQHVLAEQETVNLKSANETKVQIIPLAPPLDQADAEISGLTWCGDKLILLPQYPARLSDSKQSFVYYFDKQQINDFLDQGKHTPLRAKRILINQKDLTKKITFFDGFEAIACKDDKIWLTIEAISLLGSYQSFVVPGTIEFTDTAEIQIDSSRLVELETQSDLRNIGDEAIFIQDDKVITLHEVNDKKLVKQPKARRVDASGNVLNALPFPNIPYRITDATALDSNNRFWVINYKYGGDKFSRNSIDKIAAKYGQGKSHKKYDNVERLVEFELKSAGIVLVERTPLQLKMNKPEGRNWEGLVRLDNRGFLLITDKHPRTLLAFLPSGQ